MTDVTVTQADRDAAAALAKEMFQISAGVMSEYLNGHRDGEEFVQAFARHRQAALADAQGEAVAAQDVAALVEAYRTGNLVQIDREGMRERCRDAIASCLGDDYAMVPKNKMEWVKARGMCGGFPRDINAPFQCDYDAAADAAIAAILGKDHPDE